MQRGTLPRASHVQVYAGVSHRELDYWCRTGVLKPHNEGLGNGRWRQFPRSEVACARLVRLLRDAGHDPSSSVTASACEAVRRGGQLAGRAIMVAGDGTTLVLPYNAAAVVLDSWEDRWTLIDGSRLV